MLKPNESSDKYNSIIEKLSYSHEENIHLKIPENKEKYAKALEGYDLEWIQDNVVTLIRENFDDMVNKSSLQPDISSNWEQDTWIWWDIGKQLYYNENPEESQWYILGNPLDNKYIQEEIAYRMFGWEICNLLHKDPENTKITQTTKDIITWFSIAHWDHKKENGEPSSKTLVLVGRFISNCWDPLLEEIADNKQSTDAIL